MPYTAAVKRSCAMNADFDDHNNYIRVHKLLSKYETLTIPLQGVIFMSDIEILLLITVEIGNKHHKDLVSIIKLFRQSRLSKDIILYIKSAC